MNSTLSLEVSTTASPGDTGVTDFLDLGPQPYLGGLNVITAALVSWRLWFRLTNIQQMAGTVPKIDRHSESLAVGID